MTDQAGELKRKDVKKKTGRKQTRDRNRREGGERERFGKAKSGLLFLLLPGEGKFS